MLEMLEIGKPSIGSESWMKNGVISEISRSLLLLTPCNTPPSLRVMSSILAIESLSHDDFRLLLDRLKLLLDNLPRQLPLKSAADSDFSTFLYFELDPDLLEKTGCEVSALSETLKGSEYRFQCHGSPRHDFTRAHSLGKDYANGTSLKASQSRAQDKCSGSI